MRVIAKNRLAREERVFSQVLLFTETTFLAVLLLIQLCDAFDSIGATLNLFLSDSPYPGI